ncbi:Calcineurin-binding protein cabin-1 [Lamellibrachia satsuma]|nr:Calcineurin-binding protein cabin-1 [Lamellibrachia satsuma]
MPMIRIAALNDDVSDEGDNDNFTVQKRTKEAQEAEAFALYNEALALQTQDEVAAARKLYLQLLQLPLIKQVEPTDSAGPLQPNLALRYSTHKNLANIASQEGDNEAAIENYLEAVLVDATDVTVWHKISKLALSLHQYSLARHAYEQGLECNAKHWPCLDGVITVLYVLNNYEACLYYIGRALRRDPGYVKGLVFLRQILTEQPSLLKNTASYFKDCDPQIYDLEVDKEDMNELVGEALEMRRRKQELAKIPDPPTVTFTRPHIAFTWNSLGESLISLYDHIVDSVTRNKQVNPSQPRVSLGCRVDLTSCVSLDPTAPAPECVAPTPTLPEAPTAVESLPATVSDVMMPDATLQDRLQDTGIADLDMQDFESSSGRGRGQKRKRLQWEEAGKRRSARVRNTSQKKDEEEIVDYHELLSKILPLSLLRVREAEETPAVSVQPECPVDLSMASMAGDSQECFKGMDVDTSKTSSESVSVREQEALEVHHFLETRHTNSGVLSLLRDFLMHQAWRSRVRWSDRLSDVYCRAYSRLRAHFVVTGQTDCRMFTAGRTVVYELTFVVTGQTDCRMFTAGRTVVYELTLLLQVRQTVGCLLQGVQSSTSSLCCYRSDRLSDVYCRAYSRLRAHFEYSSLFCKNVPNDFKDMAQMCLVGCELKTDAWMVARGKNMPSPGRSPSTSLIPAPATSDFPGKFFPQDVTYLVGLTNYTNLVGDRWREFCSRVFWLKARFHTLQNDMDLAICYFDKICCWSTSYPRAIGLPEQDFVCCFVMAHLMTCQTKTPLSHDGGDPWEGVVQFLCAHMAVIRQLLIVDHQHSLYFCDAIKSPYTPHMTPVACQESYRPQTGVSLEHLQMHVVDAQHLLHCL